MIRALVLTALLGGCLGKPEPPELGSLPSKFAVGDNHACTIDDKTQLGCWGRNAEGELGRSDAALFAAPVQVGTDSGWTAVAAGRQHTCGINRGHARCWGDNGVTQSDGGTFDKDLDLGGFVPTRIFAANYGTCVLDASGRVMCWGEPAASSLPHWC